MTAPGFPAPIALILVVLASGCASALLQNDGFGEQLNAGCSTRDDCLRLEREAEARTHGCKENTIGYVRCADARADLETARNLTRKLQVDAEHRDAWAIPGVADIVVSTLENERRTIGLFCEDRGTVSLGKCASSH
jgi:hypothetical protein